MSSEHDGLRPQAAEKAPADGDAPAPRPSRWKRFGRITAWTVAAALVLGFAVDTAKPLWQHWWFAARLCDGALSASDVADVLPDRRLQSGTDLVDREGGGMRCTVDTDDRHFALSVETRSAPDDVASELRLSFTIPNEPAYVFPDGTPGFQDKFGPVVLQECPGLGRDAYGAKRRLLTRVITRTGDDPTPALLRIAVSAANRAAEKAGCGTGPLPLPERVAAPRARSLAEAADGECGWLARAPLPENPSGRPWRIAVGAHGDAPITGCTLLDGARDGKERVAAAFSGWYGDWADKPFENLLTANVAYPSDRYVEGPVLSERFGTATARCAGESATFYAHGYARGYDIGDRYLKGAQLRPLLREFAREQSRERGCDELKLPSEKVYPMAD